MHWLPTWKLTPMRPRVAARAASSSDGASCRSTPNLPERVYCAPSADTAMRTISVRSSAPPVAWRIFCSSSWLSSAKVRTPNSRKAREMALRLFTGCMKASRAPGAWAATSSISGIDATSKPVTPAAHSASITHGEGLAFTA